MIALAVAIANDKQAALRERYLAQLCAPFAERIVKNADIPDAETVNIIFYCILIWLIRPIKFLKILEIT